MRNLDTEGKSVLVFVIGLFAMAIALAKGAHLVYAPLDSTSIVEMTIAGIVGVVAIGLTAVIWVRVSRIGHMRR